MVNTNYPSVAFIMPVWGKASEQFFMRQISYLHDANILTVIIITGKTDHKKWKDIPIVSLQKHSIIYRTWHYFKRKIKSEPYNFLITDKVKSTLKRYQTNTLLIQYGPTAVAIKEALNPERYQTFVHVHGFDTQEQLCPAGHKKNYLQIASKLTTICNSKETFNRLTQWGISPKNLVVKYMGVAIPELTKKNHSQFTILSLGRLVDCKSPDRTIQAFELACEKGLNAQLIIAGDGPLKATCESLRSQSRWKSSIKITGEVTWEQGKLLYNQADMFTQHAIVGESTGQIEAFGVSIIEAMAAALPVSTCKIGGIAETVVENETGLFFEPKNIEQQAETFLKIANNHELRTSLGENGRQRVIERFSLEEEAKNLLVLLQKNF